MPQTGNIRSGALLNQLRLASSFKSFAAKYSESFNKGEFCEYLQTLHQKRGVSKDALFGAADIDRGYGYKLTSGARLPSRDTVIQLAFGLGLSADETQELLKAARKRALHPRVERDAAVLFCLMRSMTLVEAQLLLAETGLELLGKERRNE